MKIAVIVATVLILAGAVLGVAVMAGNHWDFRRLDTADYETNIHEITTDFSHISMDTDTADIRFVPAEDGRCKVECIEDSKAKHTVSVEGDTLSVRVERNKKWYDYIGIHWQTPQVTVYLPKTAYATLTVDEDTGNVDLPKAFTFERVDLSLSTGRAALSATVTGTAKIETDTGDIRVKDTTVGKLDLSVSTGKVTVEQVTCTEDVHIEVSTGKTELTAVTCRHLSSEGDTGSITLTQVVATGKFDIERSTGRVKFDRSDAASIEVETDTGDVTGSLLTDKVFITDTDTGRVDVPHTTAGGRCEISTDTGDITITIG